MEDNYYICLCIAKKQLTAPTYPAIPSVHTYILLVV